MYTPHLRKILLSLIGLITFQLGVPYASAQEIHSGSKPVLAPWAKEDIEEMLGAGILHGYPDTQFRGRRSVTRREVAYGLRTLCEKANLLRPISPAPKFKALLAALSPPENDISWEPYGMEGQSMFAPIGSDHWAYKAHKELEKAGLIRIYEEELGYHSFRGLRAIRRRDLAVLVTRLLLRMENPPELNVEGAKFADVDGDEWWYGAAVMAASSGIMQGYPDGTFRGNRYVTRNEFAVILARLFKATYIHTLFTEAERPGVGKTASASTRSRTEMSSWHSSP